MNKSDVYTSQMQLDILSNNLLVQCGVVIVTSIVLYYTFKTNLSYVYCLMTPWTRMIGPVTKEAFLLKESIEENEDLRCALNEARRNLAPSRASVDRLLKEIASTKETCESRIEAVNEHWQTQYDNNTNALETKYNDNTNKWRKDYNDNANAWQIMYNALVERYNILKHSASAALDAWRDESTELYAYRSHEKLQAHKPITPHCEPAPYKQLRSRVVEYTPTNM